MNEKRSSFSTSSSACAELGSSAFLREAGDHIGRNGDAGQLRTDIPHALCEPGRVIRPVHGGEHFIAGRLDRDVQMSGDPRLLLHVGDERIIDLIHLDAGDAVTGLLGRRIDQLFEQLQRRWSPDHAHSVRYGCR